MTIPRPTFLTEEHLTFLDDLRESGETNMYDATPWLIDKFDMTRKQGIEVLRYWIKMFSERHPKAEA